MLKFKFRDGSEDVEVAVGDDVVVEEDPGRTLGAIPRFGQRHRAKVMRILGGKRAPYVEVATSNQFKFSFGQRGDERGFKGYGPSRRLRRLDEAKEAHHAAEATRAKEARAVAQALSSALPSHSEIERLVWTRPELVPALRQLLELVAQSKAVS